MLHLYTKWKFSAAAAAWTSLIIHLWHGRGRPKRLKTRAADCWWRLLPVFVGACLWLVPVCGWAVQLTGYISWYISEWACICVRYCDHLADVYWRWPYRNFLGDVEIVGLNGWCWGCCCCSLSALAWFFREVRLEVSRERVEGLQHSVHPCLILVGAFCFFLHPPLRTCQQSARQSSLAGRW